jgi:hypothetical protein
LPAFAQGPVSRPALTSSCGGRCWSWRAAGQAHASGSSSRCRSLLRLPRNNKRRARAGVRTRGRCQHRSADAAHPITLWAQKTPFPASFDGRCWARTSDSQCGALGQARSPSADLYAMARHSQQSGLITRFAVIAGFSVAAPTARRHRFRRRRS